MGAGCSKGAAKVVTADATTVSSVDNHNSVLKTDTDVNQHGEPSHPGESQEGQTEEKPSLQTSDMSNVKTEACSHEEGIASVAEDQITQAQDADDQSIVLLTSFCEKNPKLESDLRAKRDHYQALKEALESGNLATQTALDNVTGLFNLYTKNGKPAKKVLTDFAVALGIPKLAYDIVVDRRTNCQELTTWDRKEEKEPETERNANETSAKADNEVGTSPY